jgi:hypothetical protein
LCLARFSASSIAFVIASFSLTAKSSASSPWKSNVDCFLKYHVTWNWPHCDLKRLEPPPGEDHLHLIPTISSMKCFNRSRSFVHLSLFPFSARCSSTHGVILSICTYISSLLPEKIAIVVVDCLKIFFTIAELKTHVCFTRLLHTAASHFCRNLCKSCQSIQFTGIVLSAKSNKTVMSCFIWKVELVVRCFEKFSHRF